MTAEPDVPAITCPSSLVASCAPLLGFEPSDCVVGLIHRVPGRTGPVLVRLDIGAPDQARQRSDDLLAGILGTGGAAVALVAFVDADDDARGPELASASLMAQLLDAADRARMDVVACISTNGRVWWTHGCPDPGCCAGSRSLDASVLTRVRAEYAYAGCAPLASRDQVVARVAADPAARARTARALLGLRPPTQLERWRDAQVAALDRLLVPSDRSRAGSGGPGEGPRPVRLTPVRAARAIRAFADIPVRDSMLLRLARVQDADRSHWEHSLDRLCTLVSWAPAGSVAPVATVAGIVAWTRGEGALANAALDRAEDDDSGYRLTGLARQVLASGVDPRSWWAAMEDLTEEECRAAGRRGAR